MKARKRVGLLGGTFDPLHIAHLHMAEAVREETALDEIWFLPAKIPPHKQLKKITNEEQRIQMLLQSINDVPYFQLCLEEIERDGPSYTLHTVQALQQKYNTIDFSFIVGADMVEYLPKWFGVDELMERIAFIGVDRPGSDLYPDHPYTTKIKRVNMIPINLSASAIRKRCAQGKSIRFLVPEQVYTYIKENGLYME